jgi:hypothetical protein
MGGAPGKMGLILRCICTDYMVAILRSPLIPHLAALLISTTLHQMSGNI